MRDPSEVDNSSPGTLAADAHRADTSAAPQPLDGIVADCILDRLPKPRCKRTAVIVVAGEEPARADEEANDHVMDSLLTFLLVTEAGIPQRGQDVFAAVEYRQSLQAGPRPS